MKWRWLWVIKNRKGEYWNVEGKKFWNSLHKATIYQKQPAPHVLKYVQTFDFTAYHAKGTFEISEHV